ncbi:hypothetical protein BS78_02G294400 [Paspalum vaginatum]|nr:hypothetical protein BS78_02G294400 [Paspalum vaginatum]
MDLTQATVAGKAVDAYRKALATAASAAAYAVMARELLPRERCTLIVRSQEGGGGEENLLFDAARKYLASRLDPRAMRRLGLTLSRAKDAGGRASWRSLLFLEPGDSTFTWTCVETPCVAGTKEKANKAGDPGGDRAFRLELSFDAEHTAVAVDRYVPFIMEAAEEAEQRERAVMICMNEGRHWYKISRHHPATFDTLSIVDDLDLFAGRSLVAAMANRLRYNLYDLDLPHVQSNTNLQWLLVGMSNRSVLVIEDIDCCCDAMSREDDKAPSRAGDEGGGDDNGNGAASDADAFPPRAAPAKSNNNQVTLSGLLNFIDGLWSTSGKERIIVFSTNYKDRLDPALLRRGRTDMHVYMGYCSWEAFKTLARNYFALDEHKLFPEIQGLLAEVEVTPAAVSEMLLRSDDADVALRGLKELLEEKKQAMPEGKRSEEAGKA